MKQKHPESRRREHFLAGNKAKKTCYNGYASLDSGKKTALNKPR
jgi:hypothetical protein